MIKYTIIFFLVATVCVGCKGDTMKASEPVTVELNKADYAKVGGLRILFGHRSVGENILNGVKSLPDAGGLVIKDTRELADFNAPVFAHTGIGKNTDPLSKIDDFKAVVTVLNSNIDIAFMKLCYVDITAATDVKHLFSQYTKVMDDLQSLFPHIQIVHCTVPLTTIESGLKARLKSLFGKFLLGQDDNIARGVFNKMLLDQYSGKVFDLARFESTFPDGVRAVFTRNGNQYEYLIGSYASDEGHLNKTGSKFVAKALIKFLSGL